MILGSQELIRDMNTHLILETILNKGPLSRAELSKLLGLTKATVSAIVQTLLDSFLVVEIGSADTSKGRKPIMLTFNQACGNIIAVDISIDHIVILLSDLKGENCQLIEVPNTYSRENLIPNLIKQIDLVQKKVPTSVPYGVVGICIGIHGIVHENEIIFTPYCDFAGLPIQEELSNAFHVPVFLDNEANLSALGEKSFRKDCSNLINISVHAGIGVGLILENELYTGFNGFAGEFGHTIIVPNGRICPCGNHGCLEQYTSERSILEQYSIRKNIAIPDFAAFLRAWLAKDQIAVEVLDEFILFMGYAINNIVNLLNPQLIIINSSFISNIPELLPRIRNTLKSPRPYACEIAASRLQDTAILLGGVCVCAKEFLGITQFVLSSKGDIVNTTNE